MSPTLVDRVACAAPAAGILPAWLASENSSLDSLNWLATPLREIQRNMGSVAIGLVQGTKGQWRVLFATQTLAPLPQGTLADVLDREQTLAEGNWLASPVESPVEEGWVLVARFADKAPADRRALFDGFAAAVGLILHEARRQSRLEGRAERLQALLDVTLRWSQTRNTDELLQQIAETATKLLKAERATIFLIDRTRNLLVGKPALGVEGGELLIPLEAGVVGRAIRTQQPQRVDVDVASEQALIHRDVDARLQFETRSLICVPICNAASQVIGAFELINKQSGNFHDEDEAALTELAAHAAIAIENSKQVEQLVASRKQMADQAHNQVTWIGESAEMDRVRKTIERVADTDLAILITGENGTGKEVAAQMIHYLSSRRDQVLVAVNCAAISESLLESELFGHEKGAFTDAHQARPGKFELANGGTLFLDEIGDLSPGGQAKLLRVLEEKVVVRVGGSNPIATDARVLAATNQNLAELVREKKFREDLFFRLNVVPIQLPSLRQRGEDILLLADHFLNLFAIKVRRPKPVLTAAARKRFLSHTWPGNVRELRNMMERIAYLSTEATVDAADLPFLDSPRAESELEELVGGDRTLAEATDRFQCAFIERHIQQAGGNMTEAARQMGLHRSNLYRKMKQLGMDVSDAR